MIIDHSNTEHVGYSDPHCKFFFQVYDKLKLLAEESNNLEQFVATEQLLLAYKNILPKDEPSKASKDRSSKVIFGK